MKERRKLSVFIAVQDVEDVIRPCLDSVSWADEILIIDGYSKDKTPDICREYDNVRLLFHEYENSGKQQSWGLPQCKYDYVFKIDSDERMTEALRQKLEEILSQDKIEYDGYRVRIKTKLFGKILEHDHYLGYSGMRFYKKDKTGELTKRSVHSTMDIKRASFIKGNDAYLIHEPIRDFYSHIRKMGRYADWAASDMYKKGKKVSWWHFLLRPFYKFFNHFIFKLGFMDGKRGLLLSMIAGYSVFLKYYRLYWLNNEVKKKNDKNE